MLTKCSLDSHILWDINQRVLIIIWIAARNAMDLILVVYVASHLRA